MHVHKGYAGTPCALSMKALKLEQCLGEEQLVAYQAGSCKSHQSLRNNKKFLGAKARDLQMFRDALSMIMHLNGCMNH